MPVMKVKAKILITQRFDTTKYYQQGFKEIWTDWNTWRRKEMYMFSVIKNEIRLPAPILKQFGWESKLKSIWPKGGLKAA